MLVDEQAKTRQEKERFETLFEKSNDGLVIIENNIFIACNEEAVKLMGYNSKPEILRHPGDLSPIYQPDGSLSIEKAEKMIGLCMKNGSNHFEWVHQKQDGTDFWVDVTLKRLSLENKTQVLVAWRDITLQKKLIEENEKSKNDAIHANVAKSEFLSSMSHELRTPLNAILGFSQLLGMDLRTPLTEEQKVSVDHIKASGHHLLALINEILELSALNQEKLYYPLKPLN